MRFIEGTAGSLFSDGSGGYSTTFTAQEDAIAASQALLDQVFLGIYDTDPELTNGIEDASETFIYTTYGIIKSKFLTYAAVVTTHNYSDDNEDTVYYPSTGNSPVSLTQNSADNGKVVWATWALSPNAVPVPGSLTLLWMGIISLAGINRKKRCLY